MGRTRVFFPQAALDQWLSSGRVDFSGEELVINAEGRRYKLIEAIRVLRVVSEGEDEYDLIGRVKAVVSLRELGAELLGDSMIIGDLAYEVVPGFSGMPIGTFSEHRKGHAPPSSGNGTPMAAPGSDEELLARYLLQNLE